MNAEVIREIRRISHTRSLKRSELNELFQYIAQIHAVLEADRSAFSSFVAGTSHKIDKDIAVLRVSAIDKILN